jgi:hypothetical protein
MISLKLYRVFVAKVRVPRGTSNRKESGMWSEKSLRINRTGSHADRRDLEPACVNTCNGNALLEISKSLIRLRCNRHRRSAECDSTW